MIGHLDLMALHVEALFTHDEDGQLVSVNEPAGAPAPRFFIGRTAEGTLRRFRHDVADDVRTELESACDDIARREDGIDAPIDPSRFEAILARSAPVQRTWTGPAFSFRETLPPSHGTILVTNENAQLLEPHLQAWVPDVPLCRPMVVLGLDGHAVSICCSGRRTSRAHEAALETVAAYRGRGYASRVVAAWARAVREVGCVPLYSTAWRNEASRTVAHKLGLIQFGNDLHIT